MSARLSLALALALALLAAGGAGAQAPAGGAAASARAYAISVLAPGLPNSSTPVVSSPPQSQVANGGAGFTFNAPDGTPVVTTGSYVATVNADATANPFATATAEVTDLSLFGGEVTVSDVVVRAKASAKPGNATGDLSSGGVSGLVVDGQPQAIAGRVSLADWGYAQVMAQTGAPSGAPPSYRGFVTGLDIRLTADHGGLPAGTEIQVGYAEASAQAPAGQPPASPKPKPAPKSKTPTAPKPAPTQPKAKEPKTTPGVPPSLLPGGLPPNISPNLTAGPYVFPVYGPSSFTDSYGAPRGDVSGGWHHGDDIFAPLGAPILAVAKGTVFSVGWNNIGGNRLWLRDGQGNEYYYAHLSAYTPAAVNNAHVRAGTVLGFVGNTGDAGGTPYHLHFEIHPVALLGMGYDGVVDPTPILERWKHVQDVRFAAAAGWAPVQPGANAPQAGAILLQSSDISNATGLVPGALEKAASPLLEEGAAGLLGIQQRPPRGPVYETR